MSCLLSSVLFHSGLGGKVASVKYHNRNDVILTQEVHSFHAVPDEGSEGSGRED